METISQFFSHFAEPNLHTALLVVLNLILIESLLSVDNAAVLATMVMDLPEQERNKALRIGILFAYLFRGLALLFASELIKINWLKLIGGCYLLYLCFNFFYQKFKVNSKMNADTVMKQTTVLNNNFFLLNPFWSTVIMVELMDLTFSLDNVFAAIAFTKNIYLVCTGVFIGIITMRIVASYFVKLMVHFPFLDTVAFIVIALLGIRLCADFTCSYTAGSFLCELLFREHIDLYFSLLTVSVFFLPILVSLVRNLIKGI